jgi:hypothetical protein
LLNDYLMLTKLLLILYFNVCLIQKNGIFSARFNMVVLFDVVNDWEVNARLSNVIHQYIVAYILIIDIPDSVTLSYRCYSLSSLL